MQEWQGQGKILRAIAENLNRLNLKTNRGNEWYASVRAVLLDSTASKPKSKAPSSAGAPLRRLQKNTDWRSYDT
jgi:hypothetical protein